MRMLVVFSTSYFLLPLQAFAQTLSRMLLCCPLEYVIETSAAIGMPAENSALVPLKHRKVIQTKPN